MRIGQLAEEPVELTPGDSFALTTEEIVGDNTRVSHGITGGQIDLEVYSLLFG